MSPAEGAVLAGDAPRDDSPPARAVSAQRRQGWIELARDAAAPAHYLSLIVGVAVILYLDRSNWFLGDEFEFFGRMQPGTSLNLLVPHNGHWSTVPILLTLGLYKVYGLRSFLPYALMDIAAHLAVVHLLWRWMRRLGADPWVATGLAAVFVVVGGGVENVWSWFQVSFVLPVALGLAAAFLVDHTEAGSGRDLLTWPLGVAAVMCSGVGVIMVFLYALLALLRRGWRAAFRVAVLPAVVYLAWFAAIGREYLSLQPGPLWQHFLVFDYAWTGLTSAVGATVGWSGFGPILFVALLVWLFLERRRIRANTAFVFASAGVALLYFVLLGVDRVTAGLWESTLTRYGYIGIALLLPATADVLTRLARRGVTGRVVVLTACGLAVVGSVGSWVTFVQTWNPITTTTEGQVLAAAHLLQSGAPLAVTGGAGVEPVHSGNLTVDMLRSMISTGSISADAPVSVTDMLNAELFLQVGISSSAPTGTGQAPRIDPASLPLVTATGDGCVSAGSASGTSVLQLDFAGPGAVAMSTEQSSEMTLQLSLTGTPGVASSATSTFGLTAGQKTYLEVTASGVATLLTLPAGTTTICGLGGG